MSQTKHHINYPHRFSFFPHIDRAVIHTNTHETGIPMGKVPPSVMERVAVLDTMRGKHIHIAGVGVRDSRSNPRRTVYMLKLTDDECRAICEALEE